MQQLHPPPHPRKVFLASTIPGLFDTPRALGGHQGAHNSWRSSGCSQARAGGCLAKLSGRQPAAIPPTSSVPRLSTATTHLIDTISPLSGHVPYRGCSRDC
ncbi:hypothetical protein SLA2020_086200 [Shorea laevis]